MRRVSFFELEGVKPAESLRVEFFPDRRLTAILVRDLENTPENIRIITREVTKNCKVVIARPSSPDKKFTDILYYLECPSGSGEEVAEAVEKLGIAKEVLLIDLPDERLALSVFFPILTLGERSVVMRESFYSGFMNGLREQMSEPAARAFLHLIGLNVGKSIASSLKRILEKKELLEKLKIITFIGRAQGFFDVRKVEKAGETIVIELKDNWEATVLEEKFRNKGPQCFWTKGALKGILMELTGENWDVEEKKCAADGDEACEFHAKKAEPSKNPLIP